MDDAINLGGRLKRLREASGRSTRQVASGVGIARTTYERREIDDAGLTLSEMRGVARYYDLPVPVLVAEDEDAIDAVVERLRAQAKSLVPA